MQEVSSFFFTLQEESTHPQRRQEKEKKLSKRVRVHNMQGLKATYEHKLAPISKRKFLIMINLF
eukprot:scaffold21836_cov72-Skeletonema_dohrnii-CCMP3373.AAC.1